MAEVTVTGKQLDSSERELIELIRSHRDPTRALEILMGLIDQEARRLNPERAARGTGPR